MYRWFLNKFIDENNLTGMSKIASFEYAKRMNKEVLSYFHDSGTTTKTKKKQAPSWLTNFKSEAAVQCCHDSGTKKKDKNRKQAPALYTFTFKSEAAVRSL